MTAAVTDELMGMTDAKKELPQRLRRLASGELTRVVILNRNNPVAVIVTVEQYERMQAMERMREDLEDMMAILRARSADDGTRTSLEDLEARLLELS